MQGFRALHLCNVAEHFTLYPCIYYAHAQDVQDFLEDRTKTVPARSAAVLKKRQPGAEGTAPPSTKKRKGGCVDMEGKNVRGLQVKRAKDVLQKACCLLKDIHQQWHWREGFSQRPGPEFDREMKGLSPCGESLRWEFLP